MLHYIDSLQLPLPYAFNYHFDNGVFRGLAFANFNNLKDTTSIIQNLNGKVMNGRKLRVEYKKVQQSQEGSNLVRNTSNLSLSSMGSSATNASTSCANNQHQEEFPTNHSSVYNLGYQYNQQSFQPDTSTLVRYHAPMVQKQTFLQPSQPSLDFNDPEVLEIYTQLVLFNDRHNHFSEISWQQQYLTPQHKRTINSLCSFLNLYEISDPVYLSIKRQNQQLQMNSSHLSHSPSQGFANTAMYQQAPSSTGGSIYSQHLQQPNQHNNGQQQHTLLQNGLQDESSYLIKPPQGIFPSRNITPAAQNMSYLHGSTSGTNLEKEPEVITTSLAMNSNNINLTNPLLRTSQQTSQLLRPQLTNTPSASSILLQQPHSQQHQGLNQQLQPQTTSGSIQSTTSLHSMSSSITQSMIGLSFPTSQQQQQQQRYKQHPLLQRAHQQQ